MSTALDPSELSALDADVVHALVTRNESRLHVIAYGEISTVLGWPSRGARWACKRLPPFPDQARFDRYCGCVHEYVRELESRGVSVLPPTVERLDSTGPVTAYVVQTLLPADTILSRALAGWSSERAEPVLERLARAIRGCVDERLGLDAQASNWALCDERLIYIDISTPLMRDEHGLERLDTGVFMASMPWLLRPIVRRFLLRSILDTFYRYRTVLLDLLGNLIKEGLDRHLDTAVDVMGAGVEPAITVDEVRRHYRQDARTWAFLQLLRRIDRAWQRHARRRVYPFLLPGRIERRV